MDAQTVESRRNGSPPGRLRAFWSSVALMSGQYHGRPMQVHLSLPVDSPHFDRWLEIFAATARIAGGSG